jgi:precorrin-6x reductase
MSLITEYPSNMRLPHLTHPSGLRADVCRTYDQQSDVVFVLPGGKQIKHWQDAASEASAMFRAVGWVDLDSASEGAA